MQWHKSFITKAIQHKRDIVPAYFSGRNSNFFYNLSNFRKFIGLKANIEMLYLADEMFRQKDKEIRLVFGKTIPWQTFDKIKISCWNGLNGSNQNHMNWNHIGQVIVNELKKRVNCI